MNQKETEALLQKLPEMKNPDPRLRQALTGLLKGMEYNSVAAQLTRMAQDAHIKLVSKPVIDQSRQLKSLTLLTCTGDRPTAFDLCELWMYHQSYKGKIQWVVVDDGRKETHTHFVQQVVRRAPGEGHTLCANLRAALEPGVLQGEATLFIEDDDYYSPNYLDLMACALYDHELAGEGLAHYYNVAARRYFIHDNLGHASLCQTGLRPEKYRALRESLDGDNPFVDLRIWATGGTIWRPSQVPSAVGIKGMPGRGGIGTGHQEIPKEYQKDDDLQVLWTWMNSDADLYRKFYVEPGSVN